MIGAASGGGAYSSWAVAGDGDIRNTAGNLILQSGSTIGAICINTSNNIGLGTSTPTKLVTIGAAVAPAANSDGTTLLQVYGNIGLYQNRICFGTDASVFNNSIYNNQQNIDNAGAFNGFKYNAASGHAFRTGASSNYTSMYINSSGYVGIGTAAVNGALTIYETGTAPSKSAGSLILQHGDTGKSSIVFKSSTNSDYASIVFYDSFVHPWGTGAALTIGVTHGTSGGANHLIFNPAGNVAFVPATYTYFTGLVGIGTYSAWTVPTTPATVFVNGSTYFNSSVIVSANNINGYYTSTLMLGVPVHLYRTEGSFTPGHYVGPQNIYGPNYNPNDGGQDGYTVIDTRPGFYVDPVDTRTSVFNGYAVSGLNNWPVVFTNAPYFPAVAITLNALAIYSNGHIVMKGTLFNASDERIKMNIRVATRLLPIIRQFQFISHDYLSSTAHCPIGLIAQDVHDIYPEAVRISSNFIPSIMASPSISRMQDSILLTFSQPIDVVVGDIIQYKVFRSEQVDEYKESVLAVDGAMIRVAIWPDFAPSDKLYVYGKQVDDFHHIDKTSLAMLGLGGLKELMNITRVHHTALTTLETAMDALDLTISSMKHQLEAFPLKSA